MAARRAPMRRTMRKGFKAHREGRFQGVADVLPHPMARAQHYAVRRAFVAALVFDRTG